MVLLNLASSEISARACLNAIRTCFCNSFFISISVVQWYSLMCGVILKHKQIGHVARNVLLLNNVGTLL